MFREGNVYFLRTLTMEIEGNSIKHIALKIISSKKNKSRNETNKMQNNWLEELKILNEQPVKQFYSKLVCSLFPTSDESYVKCSN